MEGSGETTLAVVSTIPPGELSRRGMAGQLSEMLPGALWGLLREQGPRTVVCSYEDLLQGAGTRFRGVILCGDTALSVVPMLLRLRQHLDTALLPVLVYLLRDGSALEASLQASELLLPSFVRHADAVLESDSGPSETTVALQRIRRMAAALSALPAPLNMPARSHRRLVLLRMLLVRGIVGLSPQRDPAQPLCHSYAPLDLIGGDLLLADLDAMCQMGLLDRAFFERICVCPSCGDGRLLFREVCGACMSADVRRGEVIHHYRCGHVAQEHLFHRGAELSCPSCGDALRHIGIDYERPAALLHCRSCDQLATEGVTQARCLGCGQVQLADAVPERVIWSYLMTPEGRGGAASGQMPSTLAAEVRRDAGDEEGP